MNGCVILGTVVMRYGFLVLAGLLFTQIVLAETFIVNSSTEVSDNNEGDCICDNGSGLCSVNTALDEAEACVGADTIMIPAGSWDIGNSIVTSEVIFQGTGQGATILECISGPPPKLLWIKESGIAEFRALTITGNCRGLSNDGDLFLFQVLVTNITTIDVNLSPIFNSGVLGISLSVISGNSDNNHTSPGAIYNGSGAQLTISHSELFNNNAPNGCGGAIKNRGVISISNTSIRNNHAREGGAICNGSSTVSVDGSLSTITGSSLTDNTATLQGGGVYQGIVSGSTYPMTLVNTTISGNRANGNGGGIYTDSGIQIASSTIAHNEANADQQDGGSGGGIFANVGATVQLKNTILAKNIIPGLFSRYSDCSGEMNSDGFNLLGYKTLDCTINTSIGDQIGDPVVIDPLLDTLQSIGLTSFYPLLPDSPAIDAGNVEGCRDYDDTVLTTDQPGEDRSKGFACDIGASESGYFAGRVLVTPVSGSETTEAGGSAKLSFKLNGIPTSSVTVPLSSSNTAEGTIAASIVFPSGLNQEQIIWVYGVDDDIEDGDVGYQVITGAVSSTDARFAGFDPDDVSVTNLDDEEVVFIEDVFLDSFE